MAHIVTCQICGKKFDRDKIQAVYHSSNRYSHQSCEPDKKLVPMPTVKPKEEKPDDAEYAALKECINRIFGNKANWALIMRQVKEYHNSLGYTYSSIMKTLTYFYDVKGNSVQEGNGGIGIVPYQYKAAYDYYYALWLAKQKNECKRMEDYLPEEKIIVIQSPQRKLKKRRLFTFLDEEEPDGQ